MNSTIARLVEDGQLEAVPADPKTARRSIEEARRHVDAARRILKLDRTGAYVLCYDAARKSISALLLASGFRAMATAGAHTAIAKAAVSFGSNQSERSRLRQLNQMRRNRNRSEYGVRTFGAQEAKAAIELATWIIEFVSGKVD